MHTLRIADRDVHMTDEQVAHFHAKYREANGCHLWTARLDRDGYGMHKVGKPNVFRAHRVAYMLAHGPIPTDQQLDHLCRNRACVNPDHLEPVTTLVNTRRSERVASMYCPNGHPRSTANVRVNRDGARSCRPCHRAAARRYRARKACPSP